MFKTTMKRRCVCGSYRCYINRRFFSNWYGRWSQNFRFYPFSYSRRCWRRLGRYALRHRRSPDKIRSSALPHMKICQWRRRKGYWQLIENADSNHGTLMQEFNTYCTRLLTGVFPHNFRDLTLVSGTIGDYAALVVPTNSSIKSMGDLVSAYKADPSGVRSAAGLCSWQFILLLQWLCRQLGRIRQKLNMLPMMPAVRRWPPCCQVRLCPVNRLFRSCGYGKGW